MNGLLNLLSVLAALLNLTAGCGLRPSTISGQGLLRFGAALARRQLNAGSTGGTISSMGAALGGNSGGGLLTGIARLHTGGISAGLETMSGTLGASSATPGLQTGLAALGAGLGQGDTRGSVLAGLGQLAAQRLQSRVSISGVQSGSSTTGSGIVNNGGNSALLLGQGIPQSPQTTAGGFFVTAASSSRSATTSMGVHTGGNTAGNSVNLVTSPGRSHPEGVVSFPGNRPTFIGPGVPGAAAPGAGPGVSVPDALGGLPEGGLVGGLSSTTRTSASTVSVSGTNTALGVGQPLQQIRHPIGGASLGTGGVGTNSATVSAAVTTANLAGGVGGVLMGIAPSTNGGTPTSAPSRVGGLSSSTSGLGDLEAVPGSRPGVGLPGDGGSGRILASGLHGGGSSVVGLPRPGHPGSGPGILPAQRLGPGTQQNGQPLGGTMRSTTGTLVSTEAMTTQIAGTTARRFMGVGTSPANGVSGPGILPAQGLGPGSQQNGQPLGGAITGTAGTLVSTAAMATRIAGTTTGRFMGGETSPTNGVSGPGIFPAQGPAQGTQQNEQTLRRTITGGGAANLQSTAVLGNQIAGHAAGRLLAVGSRLTTGISGVRTPNGGIRPGRSAAGPGILPAQGLRPGTEPSGQLLGETIGGSTGTVLSTTAMGIQSAGSTAERFLSAGSSLTNSVSGIGAPMGGVRPSSSAGGTGIEIGQRLGQAAHQGNAFIGSGSSTRQSTTVTQSQLAGGSAGSGFLAGVSPGQGSLPGTQPGSHMTGGMSRVTVSASSQSSSSWRSQTHIVRGSAGNVGAGLPSLGGHTPGVGAPGSGPIGTGVGTESTLLNAIVGASGAGHPQAGPGLVTQGGLGVISSSVGSGSVASGMVSGVVHPVQKPHRRTTSAAAAAGLALGTVAGAIALTAIGTGIASALHNGAAGGGRRIGGCSGGRGCGSGCGRRRRSVPPSKVPAEVLNEIPMNFERLY